MSSASSLSTKSSKAQVRLIPWDFAAPEHVRRLVHQRIACGWGEEDVEGWRAPQESGEFNLQWVVLEDSDPEKDARLLKHTEAYPQEQEPLIDSAVSFGGKPRTIPSPSRTFIPVGHISLGRMPAKYKTPGFVNEGEESYWISTFYVSGALQGSGLGSAAMEAVENLAISEPLCAKTLALNAINKEDPEREEKYKALGLAIPPFSNQLWYTRRGYQVYQHVEKFISSVDSTGKTWYWNFVFMKKDI